MNKPILTDDELSRKIWLVQNFAITFAKHPTLENAAHLAKAKAELHAYVMEGSPCLSIFR